MNFKLNAALAATIACAVSTTMSVADDPLPPWGGEGEPIDPCFDKDAQLAFVGATMVLHRTGGHYVPSEFTDWSTPFLTKHGYRSGTAGVFYTSSEVANAQYCYFLPTGNTGLISATGSKIWEGAFCESEDCVCSPTEHTWKAVAVGGVSGTINLDFRNCDPSSGGASAVSDANLVFSNGNKASYIVTASGNQGVTDVSLSVNSKGEFQGTVETVIGDNTWAGIYASSVSDFGKFTEGCGFDGYMFEAGANISTSAGVSLGARSASATSQSWLSVGAGLQIGVKAGEDGCAAPLGAGDRGEVRILWDGTPVTEFLEMVAMLDLEEKEKIDLIYRAECTGSEIDYYLNLVTEDAMEEFFELVDRDAVGIPHNDIDSLEWIR